jgi:hypothetical protein
MSKRKRARVVTPVGRCQFSSLAEPDSGHQFADDKYKLTLLWDKDKNINALEQACIDEAKAEWGDAFDVGAVQFPFKDGDDKPKWEGFPGSHYITPKSKNAPRIVDAKNQIMAAEDVYDGAYVRCSVTPFAYTLAGQKGVTLYLNNVQFVKDGEQFMSGGDDFDAIEDPENLI